MKKTNGISSPLIEKFFFVLLAVSMFACSGKQNTGHMKNDPEVESDNEDLVLKTKDFTKEEKEIIDKARNIIKERNIDVSGLDESLSRFGSKWYVTYSPPNHRGPGGGGWEVRFRYPSGEFIGITISQ